MDDAKRENEYRVFHNISCMGVFSKKFKKYISQDCMDLKVKIFICIDMFPSLLVIRF